MILLYLFTYFAVLVFAIMVVLKIYKYANTPVHVRWELYPVAHEGGKSEYGGSYYEEVKYWEKKREKNHLAEYWAMFEEIIFLKGVYVHNRKLWFFSFPFHFGLYLVLGTTFLIFLSAVLDLFSILSINNIQTGIGEILYSLTYILGYLGLVLTFLGTIGLLVQRLTDKKFKFYNTPMDYLNIVFILILVVSITLTLINSNASFMMSKIFVKSLITFNYASSLDTIFILHSVLISTFLLYFPITRMMHLFAKYFTYHKVRWEDELNVKGSKLEGKIKEALNFGVSWSAPHMKTGKTWAEVATNFPDEVKNERR